jgi:hypothetical protein
MQAGKKNRSVGETLMNKSSSRSHSIFTIVVECADSGGEHIRVGKLNLVDLAGSERQSKTGIYPVFHCFFLSYANPSFFRASSFYRTVSVLRERCYW